MRKAGYGNAIAIFETKPLYEKQFWSDHDTEPVSMTSCLRMVFSRPKDTQ